jgi:hypothetical protein
MEQNAPMILSNQRGFCLTELLIGLAAGVFVLTVTLETFNVVQTRAAAQFRALTQHQELRLGLEVCEQEVRLTAAEAVLTANSEEFQFLANLSALRTATTGAVTPGQTLLAVADGSGWGEGKTVSVCGRQSCEVHRLAHAGQRYQLTLAEPVQVSFPAGAAVEVNNRVAYYTKPDGQGGVHLMRMVDGGANVLVGGLNAVQFSYRDERGHVTQIPSEVRRIVIEITPGHPGHRIVRDIGLRS